MYVYAWGNRGHSDWNVSIKNKQTSVYFTRDFRCCCSRLKEQHLEIFRDWFVYGPRNWSYVSVLFHFKHWRFVCCFCCCLKLIFPCNASNFIPCIESMHGLGFHSVHGIYAWAFIPCMESMPGLSFHAWILCMGFQTMPGNGFHAIHWIYAWAFIPRMESIHKTKQPCANNNFQCWKTENIGKHLSSYHPICLQYLTKSF